MRLTNTSRSWGLIARLLHWTMAFIILFLLGLGLYMTQFVTDVFEQFALFQLHKSWGFVVFILALLRVVWVLLARTRPALPSDMPHWQARASHISHGLLYILIFVLPLSGWVMSSAAPVQELFGIRNMVFGLFEMPDPWVPGVQWIENVAKWVHFVAALLLIAVLCTHIGAALKHHFINRDTILTRMTFGK